MSNSLALSVSFLVAVNLLPLAGVLFFDWSVYEILLVFWAENLVIGLYAVARMLTLLRRNGDRRVLLLIPVFLFHFGLFTLAHGGLVVAMFRPEDHVSGGTAMSLWIPWLALLVSHGVSYASNSIGKQEYRGLRGEQVMFAPYRRIVILQVALLGGGWLVGTLGEPIYALALLVLVKIAIDVATHLGEHREQAAREQRIQKTGRADSDVFRDW